ncbi:hypothetical protein L0F63_007398, partial [Massospora cicadina]
SQITTPSMPSKIYKYYPIKEGRLTCIVCDYPYALDAPLSTLKKHIRVKHDFSIRNPPSTYQLCASKFPALPKLAHSKIPIHSLLNPVSPKTTRPKGGPCDFNNILQYPIPHCKFIDCSPKSWDYL